MKKNIQKIKDYEGKEGTYMFISKLEWELVGENKKQFIFKKK